MVFRHSRDITILIASIVHYSNLFQYFFYQFTIVPTQVEIPNFLYISDHVYSNTYSCKCRKIAIISSTKLSLSIPATKSFIATSCAHFVW